MPFYQIKDQIINYCIQKSLMIMSDYEKKEDGTESLYISTSYYIMMNVDSTERQKLQKISFYISLHG